MNRDREVDTPYWNPNKRPKVIPLREPKHFPRIVPFYPSRPLGGFFDGVLNFDGKYAEKIMRQGFEDACKKMLPGQEHDYEEALRRIIGLD
jgi:hypothetical protein